MAAGQGTGREPIAVRRVPDLVQASPVVSQAARHALASAGVMGPTAVPDGGERAAWLSLAGPNTPRGRATHGSAASTTTVVIAAFLAGAAAAALGAVLAATLLRPARGTRRRHSLMSCWHDGVQLGS
jgi:hypothetical protein